MAWAGLCAISMGAISLAAVYVPPAAKKLVLFAIADGLVLGWVAARLARGLGVGGLPPAGPMTMVFFLSLAAQAGTALESQRLLRAENERALASDRKKLTGLKMLRSAPIPQDPKSRETVESMRRLLEGPGGTFADYLQFRVSEIGIKSRRVAAAIWTVEMVLGGLAAAWIFRRALYDPPPSSHAAQSHTPSAGGRLDEGGPPVNLEA